MHSFFSKTWKRKYQYLATLTGTFSVLTSGINLGWPSPYLPQILNGTYPDIYMSNDEGSWCAVMPLIGAPVGALFTVLLVDKIGRRGTTLLFAPITFSMFIVLSLANTPLLIHLTRFFIGSVEGGLYTVLPMYLGEISEPSIRGILTTSIALSSTLGLLFINVMGFYYSIFVSSLVCSAVPLIHFFSFIWMPESPYFLIKKGRIEDARKSLQILRGSGTVEQEMECLCEAVARQECNQRARITDLFTVKSNRRALMIFLILNLTKKFSGKNPFMFYTASIFEKADGVLDPKASVIIYVSIDAFATILALFCVDRTGRKPIIIASTLGCAFALFSVGAYFFVKDQGLQYVEGFAWLPLVGLAVYNIFYSFGLELVPTVFLGELFPTSVKGVALGLCDTISILNGTIAAKLFQIVTDLWGDYFPFWLFACCCVVGICFIIKCVPETKNKTLEEIQLYLIGNDAAKK